MEKITLINHKLPDDTLFDLISRDAALWVCDNSVIGAEQISLLARLMVLPWKVVLCESPDAALITEVENFGAYQDELSRHRGFVHIVASDPSTRKLPARALPIYLLNGRSDSQERAESPKLKGMAASRRKFNMIERLEATLPKRVVVVGADVDEVAEQLSELWESEFRALITFVVPETVIPETITEHFESVADISSISIVHSPFKKFAEYTLDRCSKVLPDSKISIMVQEPTGERVESDITSAELVEQPLLDKFEIIKSNNLHGVSPNDLSEDDLNTFFDKSQHSWRAYSAGLPWMPDQSVKRKLLRALRKVSKEGSDGNSILYLISEPGAGGTTIARALAFEAAKAGFPTLLAKAQVYEPNATEITSFLHRALSCINKGRPSDQPPNVAENFETPWLLVFDRDQWDGQEQAIGPFLAEMKRSGRSVVILKVLGQVVPSEFYNVPKTRELWSLSHELTRNEVIALGSHLNKYLQPLGRTKGENDWIQFWEEHKPDIDTSTAAFWVILEFWLKGFVRLGESIQSWMVRQFKENSLSVEERLIVLEIAALTAERRAIPEQLFLMPEKQKRPLSVILENIRVELPGLALIRQDTPNGRFWAMAHDILGRYLINAVYYDRPLLEQLNLAKIQSPIELRLFFISRLTKRSALGEPRFTDFTTQFALKTLKLDERYGNAEFFYFWRDIIEILEKFPKSVSETNRTFIHHVAISRRRVAKMEQFAASIEEKRDQLHKSINQLDFAITSLDEKHDGESNLNLYNSLALAYQDLSSLELEQGSSSDLVIDLREKASAATLNALKENPNSPFVLETAAKDLLQRGRLDAVETINCAAQALGYIFQATALENSDARQLQLSKLATSALQLLHTGEAGTKIEDMVASGNPMGFLAKAWLVLTKGHGKISARTVSEFPKLSMQLALDVLNEAPRHWILIRIEYDLLVALEPTKFEAQLHLLDELDSIRLYRVPLQLRLEQLLLFYMVGRYHEANKLFMGLRGDIKRQNCIVTVPDRLRWLVGPDQRTKLLCNARVSEYYDGYRSRAQVRELRDAMVPFIPQDFGSQRMAPGQRFRCHITFGAMGPFIKAPLDS